MRMRRAAAGPARPRAPTPPRSHAHSLARTHTHTHTHTHTYPQVMGIYLDDMQSGVTIVENHFVDCHVGVYVGGGRDVTVSRNTFREIQDSSVRIDDRGQNWRHDICTQDENHTGILLQQLFAVRSPPSLSVCLSVRLSVGRSVGRSLFLSLSLSLTLSLPPSLPPSQCAHPRHLISVLATRLIINVTRDPSDCAS